MRGPSFGWLPLLLGALVLVALLPLPTRTTGAQVQGATMTVLRGQVAIIHPDGSAIQPAPSGTTIAPGDEIRTVGGSDALITFFVGTEIEMGPDTVLVVERISAQGDRIEVSLKQVFGMTLSRIQSFADPGSSYRIEAGGAVALIRGSDPFLIGPRTMQKGNLVAVGCGTCGPSDVLQIPGIGVFPLSPPIIYVFEVEKVNGRWVPVSPVVAFAFKAGVDERQQGLDAMDAFDYGKFSTRDQAPGSCSQGIGCDLREDTGDDDDDGPAVTTTTRAATTTTGRTTTTRRTAPATTTTTTPATTTTRPATTTTAPATTTTAPATTTIRCGTTTTATTTRTTTARTTTTTTTTRTRTTTSTAESTFLRGDDVWANRQSGELAQPGVLHLVMGQVTTCGTTTTDTSTETVLETTTETETRRIRVTTTTTTVETETNTNTF